MNEELTNEDKVFQAWLNDAATSVKCVWITPKPEYITRLARMYFEERAKQKDDVWEYAPDGITTADVYYGNNMLVSATPDHTFTRELPKTRADEIADEAAKLLPFACVNGNCNYVRDTIKSALNKYAEELEGKE